MADENTDASVYKTLSIRTNIHDYGGSFGVMTGILNMDELAGDLGRSAYYTTMYIAGELGVAATIDNPPGLYCITGCYDVSELIEIINKFIRKFIECYKCGYPQTQLIVSETNVVLECGKCGFLSEVDGEEKLAKLMISEAKNKGDELGRAQRI